EGEEQLVVFAVGQGLIEIAAEGEGKAVLEQLVAAMAGGGETRQIGGETVAEIHHGVQFEMGNQPARFREPRGEIEMLSRERTTKAASDVEGILGLAARPQDAAGALDPTGERDAEKQRPR